VRFSLVALSSGRASSWYCCSGEADVEAALRSRSSRRRFNFLPEIFVRKARGQRQATWSLTVIPLSNPILNTPPLGKV
jgi:hypothetical protein